MCKGLQELVEDSRTEGWNSGRSEGVALLAGLNKKLVEEGRMNDLMKSIMDREYRDRLLKECGLIE